MRSVRLRLPASSTDAALLPTVLDARTWEDADQGVVVVDTPRWAWVMWRAAGRGKCHTKGNSLKLLSCFFLGRVLFWTAIAPETTRTLRRMPCVNIPAWSCGVESCYASEILSFKLLVNNRDVVRSLDFFFSLFFFFCFFLERSCKLAVRLAGYRLPAV